MRNNIKNKIGEFFLELSKDDENLYKEEFDVLHFGLTIRTYSNAYYSQIGHISKIELEDNYKNFINKGLKDFQHNGVLINCSYELINNNGLVFSLTFEKNLDILKQLENFRQNNIFRSCLISDYPFMVEEFGGKICLHYGLGWVHITNNWDKQKEIENLKKNLPLEKKLLFKLKPKLLESYIQKLEPKCYTNCQEKMKGKTYLELMDCEKLFGTKEQEMGR